MKSKTTPLREDKALGLRSLVTPKLCEAHVLLNARPWRTQSLALSFTGEKSDEELMFNSHRHTTMQSLLEALGLTGATTAAPACYWPIRVQLTREEQQLVALQHPHTALALCAKGRFKLKRAPSRLSMVGRRWVQLAIVPGEELPVKTAGRPKLATGPCIGAAAPACLVLSDTGVRTATALQQQPEIQAPGDNVQALQLMIQLAGQMRCSLPVLLELNRILRERSAAPRVPPSTLMVNRPDQLGCVSLQLNS